MKITAKMLEREGLPKKELDDFRQKYPDDADLTAEFLSQLSDTQLAYVEGACNTEYADRLKRTHHM